MVHFQAKVATDPWYTFNRPRVVHFGWPPRYIWVGRLNSELSVCGKKLAFLFCTVLVACGLQHESGNLIVTDKAPLNTVSASWPLLDGDNWYYIDSSGNLAARNIKAHKTVVVCKLPVGATAFAVHSGHVFIQLISTAIVSIDVNSARIEWQTSRFGPMTDGNCQQKWATLSRD